MAKLSAEELKLMFNMNFKMPLHDVIFKLYTSYRYDSSSTCKLNMFQVEYYCMQVEKF